MLNIAVLADGRVPAATAATEVIDGLCKSSTKIGSMSESVNNVGTLPCNLIYFKKTMAAACLLGVALLTQLTEGAITVYNNSACCCMNIYPRSAANLVSSIEECEFNNISKGFF